jgi:hypothetical protein
MRRRKFFAAAMTAAVWLSAQAKAGLLVDSLGRPLVTGNLPLQPPIVSGSLFDRQVTFYNPASQATTRTNPFVTFGHPIAPDDFPTSGYKPALYDSTGTTKIMDLQVDQVVEEWGDSISHAVFSGYLNGSSIAAGNNASYRVKAIPGTPDTTPCCTLAQLRANSDLKAVVSIFGDTYTVSVNSISSTYGPPPGGTGYPQGFTKTWKTGPQCCEWSFGQYLVRDSDSAVHRWLILEIYVTALSPTGPFMIRHALRNPNSYAANPSGTIGDSTIGNMSNVDKIEYFDGSTSLGFGQGGPLDPISNTFLPSAVNPAEASITFSPGLGAPIGNLFFVSVGFSSTGTFPGGLQPFDTTTYWPWINSTKNIVLFTQKLWMCKLVNGNVHLKQPANGVTINDLSNASAANYCISNGAYYFCTTGGVSAGLNPSGATFTDGTVVWTRVSADLSTGGNGVHTLMPKVTTATCTKTPGYRPDSRPWWYGAGTYPKLLIGYDFDYLTTKTKAIPPFDPTVTCTPWVGAAQIYTQNTPVSVSIFINAGSESRVDERVNIMSPSAIASIYMPGDENMADYTRIVSMSFMDRQLYQIDERGQTPLVANFGPDRAGANYPNMAPTNSSWNNRAGGNPPHGSPPGINAFWNYNTANFYGYGTSGPSPIVDVPDASHMPFPHFWPYLTSGDPLFLDTMIEMATCFMGVSSTSLRSWSNAGLTYTWPMGTFQQARSLGWQFKIWDQTQWLIPANHVAKALFTDVMEDFDGQFLNYLQAVNTPENQANGYVYQVYTSLSPKANIEPWMNGYWVLSAGLCAARGNRPGIKAFLEGYYNAMWLFLFDSDLGGTEISLDAQLVIIADTTGNPPPAGTWLPTPQARFACLAAGSAYNGTYPPPGGIIRGLLSQNPSYNYYTAPIASSAYLASNRAALIACAMAGMAQYDKVLTRTNTMLATYFPIQYVQPTGTGNINGVMWAFAKP